MQKATFGLDENLACCLSYITWIAGVIFFVSEKENKNVRFHAMQSIMFGVVMWVVSIVISILSGIPLLGLIFTIISSLLWIAQLAVLVILAVKAYKGEKIKLPIIGDMAEKQA